MASLADKKKALDWSNRNAQGFQGILDVNQFLPVTGDIQSGIMASQDLQKGNYGSAALNSLGLLPFIPALGGSLKNITEPYIKSGVNLDVSEFPKKGELYLSRIEIPKEQRGAGIGTQVMEDLINYGNQTNQKITLTPSTDFGATSVGRLKDFYKRFGFVENKGKNKDFSTRESMYKLPDKNK